jgi:hypothetical protein
MSYRDDIDALEARATALDHEVSRVTTERDRAHALLEGAKLRAKTLVLDNIRVASPCKASWDDMTGDDRVRFCGKCSKHVYNLSNMSRDEAEQVVFAAEGRLCTRFYRRADGTLLTSDCKPMGNLRRVVATAGVTLAAVVAIGGAAVKVATLKGDERGEYFQGDVTTEEFVGETWVGPDTDPPPPADPIADVAKATKDLPGDYRPPPAQNIRVLPKQPSRR